MASTETAPRPVRRPGAEPGRRRRLRPALAAGVVGALALAWLFAGRHPTPANPATESTATSELAGRLAHPERCTNVAAPMPTMHCVDGGVDVDVRLLGDDLGAAYEREVGVALTNHDGPPLCARGQPEERTWSRPGQPAVVVGRYECGLEHGRAALWWTDEQGLLWHALAHDANVAALFDWWRSRSSE